MIPAEGLSHKLHQYFSSVFTGNSKILVKFQNIREKILKDSAKINSNDHITNFLWDFTTISHKDSTSNLFRNRVFALMISSVICRERSYLRNFTKVNTGNITRVSLELPQEKSSRVSPEVLP